MSLKDKTLETIKNQTKEMMGLEQKIEEKMTKKIRDIIYSCVNHAEYKHGDLIERAKLGETTYTCYENIQFLPNATGLKYDTSPALSGYGKMYNKIFNKWTYGNTDHMIKTTLDTFKSFDKNIEFMRKQRFWNPNKIHFCTKISTVNNEKVKLCYKQSLFHDYYDDNPYFKRNDVFKDEIDKNCLSSKFYLKWM
jgi:hypothetical protein